MPPGKKKRKRRSSKSPPSPFDVFEEKICVRKQESSVSGELSLAAMFLIQSYFKSQHIPNSRCSQERMCQSLKEVQSLGLGGKLLSVGIKTVSEVAGAWVSHARTPMMMRTMYVRSLAARRITKSTASSVDIVVTKSPTAHRSSTLSPPMLYPQVN